MRGENFHTGLPQCWWTNSKTVKYKINLSTTV